MLIATYMCRSYIFVDNKSIMYVGQKPTSVVLLFKYADYK